MKDDKFYLLEAIKEAKIAANKGEVPVGCTVVIDGEIISRSHNLKETTNLATSHAEILAINAASEKLGRWILDDATIYITLEPCLMCAGAIFQARIKRVVYALSEPKYGGLGSLINFNDLQGINHRVEVTSGILEEEVKDLMQDFFRKIRKQKT